MTARLAPRVEAMALLRRAEAEGGFGTILHSGDNERGALLLVIRQRGQFWGCRERVLGADGGYRWEKSGPTSESGEEALAIFLGKRLRFDPDGWCIELDIADGERFIAETS